jgi:hypothetical protein
MSKRECCLLVAISEASELLLSSSIPDVELDGTVVSVEHHGVNLNTEGSNVLLLEFSGQMALDESCFTNTTITDEDELEFRDCCSLSFHL